MLGRLILFIAIILVGAGLVMPVNCAPDECKILDHGLFNPDRFEADTNVGIVGNLYGLLLLAILIPGLVALINFDRLSVTGSALVVTLTAAIIFSRFYMLDDQNLGWGWGLIGAGCLFWLASSLLTPSPALAAIPMDASHTLPAVGFPQAGARPMGPAAGGLHHTIIAGEEPMRPQAGFHTVIEENFNPANPPQPAPPYGQPSYGQPATPPNLDPFGATRIDGPIPGGPPVDPLGATMLDNSVNLNATQAGQHRQPAPPPVDPNEATRIDSPFSQTPPQQQPPQRPATPPTPVDDQAMFKTVIDGGQGQTPPPPSFRQPTPPSTPTPPQSMSRPAPPPDLERTNIVPAEPDPTLPPTDKTPSVSDLPPTGKTPTPPPQLPPMDPNAATAFHQVAKPPTPPPPPKPTPPPAPAPEPEPLTPPPPAPKQPDMSVSQIMSNLVADFDLDDEEDEAPNPPTNAPFDMDPIVATLVIPPSKDTQKTVRPNLDEAPADKHSTPAGQSTPQLDEPSGASVQQESHPPVELVEPSMVVDMTGEVPSEGLIGEGEIPSQEMDFVSDEVAPAPPPPVATDDFKTQLDVDTGASESDDDDDAALWKTQIDIN